MQIATGARSAYRRWQLCWGASTDEVAGTLLGDDMCPSPSVSFTRAITIAARPDEVWPWLVRVGFGPDGRYSYGVNSAGVNSAGVNSAGVNSAGVNSAGVNSSRPTVLHIESFRRPEWLLWETAWGSWVWVLRPAGTTSTRLITRGRQRLHIDPVLPGGVLPTEDADFRLVRTMLTGIKRRSEAWAAERAGQPATAGSADLAADLDAQPHTRPAAGTAPN